MKEIIYGTKWSHVMASWWHICCQRRPGYNTLSCKWRPGDNPLVISEDPVTTHRVISFNRAGLRPPGIDTWGFQDWVQYQFKLNYVAFHPASVENVPMSTHLGKKIATQFSHTMRISAAQHVLASHTKTALPKIDPSAPTPTRHPQRQSDHLVRSHQQWFRRIRHSPTLWFLLQRINSASWTTGVKFV